MHLTADEITLIISTMEYQSKLNAETEAEKAEAQGKIADGLKDLLARNHVKSFLVVRGFPKRN